MANIKVKDLSDTSTVSTDNQVMVLTNDEQNQVQNITVENLITNIISSDINNVVEQAADGKLFVETPEIITGDLEDLTTANKYNLVDAINEVDSDISNETTNRVNADNNLQSQIDAITAASDVTDIVGTYADLEDYDTTDLTNKSIIKVLQDENENNATTYYRWVITGGVGAWVLIGQEGPYYTISQADNKFATQVTTGSLSNLDTINKTSLVSAINEAYALIPATSQKDYIDNSKGVLSGEVSSNALILPQIQSYAHSTFDVSKFTLTGTPTITSDGIASGFSNNNYLTKDISSIGLSTANSFEIIGNFTSTSISTQKTLCFAQSTGQSGYFGLIVNNSKFMLFLSSNGTRFDIANGKTGSHTLSDNTYYYYKIAFDGTSYKVSYSTDGDSWTNDISVSSNTHIVASNPLYIGKNAAWAAAVNETVDLKQFSITVDGIEVFSGNKTGTDTYTINGSTVSIPYTLSKTGSKIVDSAYRTQVQAVYNEFGIAPYYTLSDTDFTLPMGELYGMIDSCIPNHICKTAPKVLNYGGSIIGSLTDTDGVLSGFSTNNYYQISSHFAPANYTWEMNFKVTTGNDVASQQEIIADGNNGIELQIKNSLFAFEPSNSVMEYGTYTVLANTTYYIKVKFTGTSYIVSYSTDGTTYTDDITYTSSTVYAGNGVLYLGKDYNNNSEAWLGTIDLNGCNIIVNNRLLWQGIAPINNGYPTETNPAVVVDSYVNGASWYRVYSDGWSEQGGYTSAGTVNLLKSYTSTDYTVVATCIVNDGYIATVHDKATNSFILRTQLHSGASSNIQYANWQASGYIK